MSESNSSLTFGQWIQHVQYEIRNLLVSAKQIFLSRAYLSYICNLLRNFSNSLHSISQDDRKIDAETIDMFEQVISLINSYKDLFSQLTETTWYNSFISKDLNFVVDQVSAISEKFNGIVLKLKLVESPPISYDAQQAKVENIHDIGILQQLLENISTPEIESKIQDVKDLRDKLSKEAGIDNESKKPKALAMSVIAESLSSLEKWEINYEDLELQKKIGSGGFAEVYLGYRKSDGTVVAVKKLHQQLFDEIMLEMFKSEVLILTKLQHYAILPFVGACTRPPFCIVTRFMSGGSLFSRLHAKEAADRLSSTQLTIIALGIAYGMEYLHNQNMLHRDLKSLNILLDVDGYPKICDFGMAQTKSTGSEPVQGGIGTSQWMAPEVLASQRYDEKADVYSYGIILWEMLTGDVPYRGLRDIQVAMTVINQHNRPKIPKNCPQNLAKFIRVCWHSDPDKRPEFKTIVRALETGAISFPGTDLSKLKSYVNQFKGTSSVSDEPLNIFPSELSPDSLTTERLEGFIKELKQHESAIPKLAAAVQNQDLIPMLAQYDTELMPLLVEYMTNCTDSHIMEQLINLLSELLKDESLMRAFLEHGGSHVMLDVLPQFATSAMSKILDCFIMIANVERCIFTQAHLSRIAIFLLSSDLAVRETAINLINEIIERQCFEDDSIFSVVVENLLRNSTPETKSELLLSTLKTLIQITQFEGAKAQLRCVEGPDRICTLMEHDDFTILATSLRLLQLLFEGTAPKQRTISSFLTQFTSVIGRADYDVQLEALNALTMLMDNTLVFKEVAACKTFAESFSQCITSEDIIVQVSSLRICFAFCSNQITQDGFLYLLVKLLDLLKSSTFTTILAAYSISALLAVNDPIKTLGENADQLHVFLENALALESELTAPAIRLVGVLASTMSGASLLERWDVMQKVAALLNSTNEELNHLAVMAMTAMSAASPDLPVMRDSIPLLFNACRDPSFGSYPLICLSNVTVDPQNAVACVPFIPELLMYINGSDKVSIQRALVTLRRVLLVPESDEMMTNSDVINAFFDAIQNMWESEHAPILYDIIENITSHPFVCSMLKDSGLVDIINDKLMSCQLTDSNRPKFIRIRTRLLTAQSLEYETELYDPDNMPPLQPPNYDIS